MSRLDGMRTRFGSMRALALLAALGLIASFTSVLYGLVDVAGGTGEFGMVIGLALLGGTALAGVLRPRHALVLATAVLVVGMGWYLTSLPHTPRLMPILQSNVELLTGQSVHQIRRSGTWALAVAPAPIFVTWYFALRRWYGWALLVGGAMLAYVVLTGDASLPITLVGVVGGISLLGFGDLDRHGGTTAGAEYVAISLAIMVAIPLVVTVVPGGVGSPLSLVEGEGRTLESSLLETDAQFTIEGAIELSPDVRFTVESEQGHYWKVDSYDRYTGEGWVRTGGATPLGETTLEYPLGPREIVSQQFNVESRLTTLPAAWRPVGVGRTATDDVAVTDHGDLTAIGSLSSGDSYRVTSAVPASFDALANPGPRAYPEEIRETYLRLPESTPDRVGERTAEIAANASTPYETAVSIERWLEENREYSLDIDRPEENIADSFLFEMEQGYCTYYATTMVVMLRSEGVPARLATGYTTGQQVGENRWVVRGLDAHSWVEVYFQDLGWIAFDPTPSAPRQRVEQNRIQEARQNNVSTVDTQESARAAQSPASNFTDPGPGPGAGDAPANSPRFPNITREALGVSNPAITGSEPGTAAGGNDLPSREDVVLGGIVILGIVAGARRTGVDRWIHRSARVVWQRRVDPETDVRRAYERGEIILARRYRPRETGETVRQYLEAVDAPPAARELATIRERSRYGEAVDEAMADRAIELVEELRELDVRSRGSERSRTPNW